MSGLAHDSGGEGARRVAVISAEIDLAEARLRELKKELHEAHRVDAERQAQLDKQQGRSNACAVEQGGESPFNLGPIHWREDGTCSYCGSLTVERAIQLLRTEGTQYSGADWKYGWPHKFYIGSRKFYNNHLRDASPEQFKEFSELSEKLFGVRWNMHPEKGLGYFAIPGVQKYGTIGSKESPNAG